MKKNTSERIIKYINLKKRVTAKNLVDHFEISRQAMFKHHLSKLLESGVIYKIGKPPRVFYSIKDKEIDEKEFIIDKRTKKIIDDNYLIITPSGEKKEGMLGFIYWCQKNDLNVPKTAREYIKTLKKYRRYKKGGLINGIRKIKNTFDNVYLDNLYYIDFYSIERFGKTKLGQMLLYGKQSGDRRLIKKIVFHTKPQVDKIIKKHKIDVVAFVPWTVKRERQFMRELERGLKLNTRIIKIEKVKTDVIVPQKTLSKLIDRIENAKKTFVVSEFSGNNVLLIDDAVGSGATLNEIAKQIKDRGFVKKVIGLSVTGSFKGFDVISEI